MGRYDDPYKPWMSRGELEKLRLQYFWDGDERGQEDISEEIRKLDDYERENKHVSSSFNAFGKFITWIRRIFS